MSKNKKESTGFFKKCYQSITKFEKYSEMSAEGTTKAIKYLVKLMLIFSIIVAFGLEYKLYQTINKSVEYINNQLPDLSYKEGKLDIDTDKTLIIDSEIPSIDQIIIDTKTDSEDKVEEYINSIPTDNTGIIILKDKAIAKAVETNNTIEYKYEEIFRNIPNLNKENFTKQDITNYLSGSGAFSIYSAFFVLMIIYVFILYFISVLIDTLLIAVFGNITVLFTKLRIKFSAVYNMAVYSLTLSILLNALYLVINSITGFEMKYFQIMYISIAYVYMVAAIFMIRLDFEKKQAELMKIMEEQKKVKKEMEEKEANQDQEEKEPKEKESDSTDDKEQNEEPDGSEA